MISGKTVVDSDHEVMSVDGVDLCCVEEFPYLVSLVAPSVLDVDRHIAKASQAFVALRKTVFGDKNTKRRIYQVCVLSALLHGAECWIFLKRHRKINTFHHKYLRAILGISNRQQ